MVLRTTLLLTLTLTLTACQNDPTTPGQAAPAPYPPATNLKPGRLEIVHTFRGPMPTGVTVSHDGRIFVCYPRWEDPVTFTVAEIRDGREIPYPNQQLNTPENPEHFLSVQSVVVDPNNRLWALDSGSINMEPIRGTQWPKLVAIDLNTNQVVKTIHFPPTVVLPTTYLNDVRFDLRRGAQGMAFITDSAAQGPNGIIVVDLATGQSWRKLHDHPSTKSDPTFVAEIEGQSLMMRKPNQPAKPLTVGSDGIALSADGSRLFYTPLSSRELYSVSTDALADPNLSDNQVAQTILHEDKEFASDGLEADSQNRLYLTDWEHNAIIVRTAPDQFATLVHDDRLWWPDTLSLATNKHLYIIANQLHRQAKFHNGQDQRQQPYHLFRLPLDAQPVLLK